MAGRERFCAEVEFWGKALKTGQLMVRNRVKKHS